MVGLGVLVLFQALMNPTRLMLGVEAAFTCGGRFADSATSDQRDSVANNKTQNLLLATSDLSLYHEVP